MFQPGLAEVIVGKNGERFICRAYRWKYISLGNLKGR